MKRGRQRAESDGKVAEVEGWLGRKGWQQRSLKMCCSSVTWRRPCLFRLLLSNNSLVTSLHCQDAKVADRTVTLTESRKKKKKCGKKRECAWNNSIWLIQIAVLNSSISFGFVCLFFFGFTGDSVQPFSFCFLPLHLSERESFNNRLTRFLKPPLTYHLHTPQRRSYRDTH